MQISQERLCFTTLVAAGLHTVVLLGLNISLSQPLPISSPIAIKLQQGGDALTADGSAVPPRAQSQTQTQAQTQTQVQPRNQPKAQPTQAIAEPIPPRSITAPSAEPNRENTKSSQQAVAQRPRTAVFDRQAMRQQIAQLDQQTARRLGDSRLRNLAEVGALSASESAYLAMWRRKCERLGGNNYPVGRLQGELTMRVVIHHSGRLLEVTLLRSSGHPALDEAALRTVRQAAPYQPFNVDMRKRYDELSFTRTWQFSRRGAAIN